MAFGIRGIESDFISKIIPPGDFCIFGEIAY